MLSAPLILGNDPRHMNSPTLDILLAPEILALSQDPLALQARKASEEGILRLWLQLSNCNSYRNIFRYGMMTPPRCG